MPAKSRWVKRREHQRATSLGRVIFVRETWVLTREGQAKAKRAYRHPCPECGAGIVSVRMKAGGWAHFEGGKGLGRVKHPCLHRGEGISKRRDRETPDLFDL